MRFIKQKFRIDTLYPRVEKEDGGFYEGLGICFDMAETRLKSVETETWLDFKACKHLIEEISEVEFQAAFEKMIDYLTYK